MTEVLPSISSVRTPALSSEDVPGLGDDAYCQAFGGAIVGVLKGSKSVTVQIVSVGNTIEKDPLKAAAVSLAKAAVTHL